MDEWKGKHIPCDEMTLNMEIRPSIEVFFLQQEESAISVWCSKYMICSENDVRYAEIELAA